MRKRKACLAAVEALLLAITLGSEAIGAVRLVAEVGDPIPGRNDFLSPIILGDNLRLIDFNDQGHVVFMAIPSSLSNLGHFGTDGLSIYRGDPNVFVEVARPGDLAPDARSEYGAVHAANLNDAGQVLFLAEFFGPARQITGDIGCFRWDGDSTMQMVRTGDPSPDSNGRIPNSLGFGSRVQTTGFNNLGHFVFSVELAGTNGGASDHYAILQSNGDNLIPVVRAGQLGSDGHKFRTVSSPAVNEAGQVGFLATLDGVVGASLFRTDGETFTGLVRYQQISPRGDATLLEVPRFSFNNSGQVAFFASVVIDSNDTRTSRWAVFQTVADRLLEIAREGDPAPDGNGNFSGFHHDGYYSPPSLNNAGQVTFFATLSDTSGGGDTDNVALYRGGDSGLI